MFEKMNRAITRIKQEKPLVLNITNYVTMDFVANGLLSLGASPVMSQAKQETEDLVNISKSIVINLGTLNDNFIALCEHACSMANQLNKPIILDPVGAGATAYRTHASLELINNYAISIIRGNAGEIMALSGMSHKTKGVDSLMQSHDAIESAKTLSKRHNAAVVVSGKTDVIVDHERINQFDHGSPLMPMITGTGCLLSAVVAGFHGVEKDRFEAASIATLFYGLCGEHAAKKSDGPGSFRSQFLDTLYSMPNGGSI